MRVLVLGAGGPAGANVCFALRESNYVFAHDDNPDHLNFCESADELVTGSFPEVDVVWAQPDRLVLWMSEHRDNFPAHLLPRHQTIVHCQDKHRAVQTWAEAGLRTGSVDVGPEVPDWLHVAKQQFGLPFWLRARHGAGARAATRVDDLRTGYHWIRYWATRGEDLEWVAEEYLPGKDYCWTSLWDQGALVAAFTRRRDEWLYPQNSPSGITGTPTVSTVVHDAVVNAIARSAVLEIDPEPHGAFAVDLREDIQRVPRPTEINAGRWPTSSPLYSEIGPNLPDLAVRIADGETVQPLGEDIYPEGVRLFRHIDCGHVFTGVPAWA